MDDFDFLEDLEDEDDEFILSDDLPLDDEFIRTHFNTIPDGETIHNFPFVEDDVDAITDYELFSRGFGYLDEKKANKEELKDYAKKSEIPDVSEFVTKDTNELENYPLSSSLSDVAFSGDYDDLLDKPTLFSGDYDDLTNKPTIPTKTSDLTNDSGFITKSVNDLTNYTKSSDLSTVATTGDYDDLLDKPTLFSGNYNDLTNKPTIPTKTSDLTNDSGFINKSVNDLTNYTKSSDLSTVATTGDYDDLLDKPTLFSGNYNDLTNKPTIPTKTSDLTNDSGFITKLVNDLTNYTKTSDLSSVATSGSYNDLSNKPTIPTKTSDLTNDSNFLTLETGTWTPNMINATVNYSIQSGRYIKIGKVVFINCRLRGTITSNISPYYAQISGLPYLPNDEYAGSLYEHYNCCVNSQNQLVKMFSSNGTGYIALYRDNDGAGSELAQWNSGLGTFYLSISGFYFID